MPGRPPLVKKNPPVTAKVDRDEEGLFVMVGRSKFRPGAVEGYDNRFDMREGNLKKGRVVRTTRDEFNDHQDLRRFTREYDIRKLSTKDGSVFWHKEGEKRDKGLRDHPEGAIYDKEGRRSLFIDEDQKGLFVAIPHSPFNGRAYRGVREKHRIAPHDAARFAKGQPVDLYWKQGLMGNTASIIARDTGEATRLKYDKNPDAPTTLLERAQQNMMAMAASMGR